MFSKACLSSDSIIMINFYSERERERERERDLCAGQKLLPSDLFRREARPI